MLKDSFWSLSNLFRMKTIFLGGFIRAWLKSHPLWWGNCIWVIFWCKRFKLILQVFRQSNLGTCRRLRWGRGVTSGYCLICTSARGSSPPLECHQGWCVIFMPISALDLELDSLPQQLLCVLAAFGATLKNVLWKRTHCICWGLHFSPLLPHFCSRLFSIL